ncbi:hypothetical protein P7C70_g2058, partial [Phenoliferia sp. Uapishka_3]
MFVIIFLILLFAAFLDATFNIFVISPVAITYIIKFAVLAAFYYAVFSAVFWFCEGVYALVYPSMKINPQKIVPRKAQHLQTPLCQQLAVVDPIPKVFVTPASPKLNRHRPRPASRPSTQASGGMFNIQQPTSQDQSILSTPLQSCHSFSVPKQRNLSTSIVSARFSSVSKGSPLSRAPSWSPKNVDLGEICTYSTPETVSSPETKPTSVSRNPINISRSPFPLLGRFRKAVSATTCPSTSSRRLVAKCDVSSLNPVAITTEAHVSLEKPLPRQVPLARVNKFNREKYHHHPDAVVDNSISKTPSKPQPKSPIALPVVAPVFEFRAEQAPRVFLPLPKLKKRESLVAVPVLESGRPSFVENRVSHPSPPSSKRKNMDSDFIKSPHESRSPLTPVINKLPAPSTSRSVAPPSRLLQGRVAKAVELIESASSLPTPNAKKTVTTVIPSLSSSSRTECIPNAASSTLLTAVLLEATDPRKPSSSITMPHFILPTTRLTITSPSDSSSRLESFAECAAPAYDVEMACEEELTPALAVPTPAAIAATPAVAFPTPNLALSTYDFGIVQETTTARVIRPTPKRRQMDFASNPSIASLLPSSKTEVFLTPPIPHFVTPPPPSKILKDAAVQNELSPSDGVATSKSVLPALSAACSASPTRSKRSTTTTSSKPSNAVLPERIRSHSRKSSTASTATTKGVEDVEMLTPSSLTSSSSRSKDTMDWSPSLAPTTSQSKTTRTRKNSAAPVDLPMDVETPPATPSPPSSTHSRRSHKSSSSKHSTSSALSAAPVVAQQSYGISTPPTTPSPPSSKPVRSFS